MRVHADWLLLPQRLAWHEPSGIAVVADVHLGYGAARRRQGDAVPLPGMAHILAPLAEAARTYSIRGLVVAGDLFERGYDAELFADFHHHLDTLGLALLGLVPGNHDRGVAHRAGLPLFPEGYMLGDWTIRHDEPSDGAGVVLGHWHPAVRLNGRKRPCFLVGPRALVLPAYSRDAAGVDLRSEPRWRDWRFCVCLGTEVVEVSARRRLGRK